MHAHYLLTVSGNENKNGNYSGQNKVKLCSHFSELSKSIIILLLLDLYLVLDLHLV